MGRPCGAEEYWSFRHIAFSPYQHILIFWGEYWLLLLIIDWLFWYIVVLSLCYCIKNKEPSVQRVKKLLNVAKMCPRLCVYRVTVLISIKVCNILTGLRFTCYDPKLWCVAPDWGWKNTTNETKWTHKIEKYCPLLRIWRKGNLAKRPVTI